MDEREASTEAGEDPIAIYAGHLARAGSEPAAGFEALCAAHPACAAELRELEADRVAYEALEARLAGEPEDAPAAGSPSASGVVPPERVPVEETLAELRAATPREWPFEPRREIGSGTFGVVEEVSERTLRRRVARKTLRAARPGGVRDTRVRHEERFYRFLEEAQVLAQLDHPGIVTVHSIGVDPDGCPYFTMPLVKGVDFLRVIRLVHEDGEGWGLPRALEVVVKVCDALAYAHSRGVVHRDLKPEHLRIGRFGETYVLDWGLASVRGRPDPHDLRIRPRADAEVEEESGTSATVIATDRAERRSTGSSLRTLDGTALGTPAYMSPEQARGELEAVGPRSDVYAVGAILYHLLTGSAPYCAGDSVPPPRVVHALLLQGPPRPVHALAPGLPPELVTICEKAMERDPAERYPTMEALARDLRAFLEERVVRAYETGPLAELRKWVRRNRRVALLTGGALLTAFAALAVSTLVYQHGRAELLEQDRVVNRLTDATVLDNLDAEIAALGPALPGNEGKYSSVLEEIRGILSRESAHRATLAKLLARSHPSPDDGAPAFDSKFDTYAYAVMKRITDRIDAIHEPVTGALARLQDRLDFLLSVKRKSEEALDVAQAWKEATDAIERSDRYGGLHLDPQIGLVPLRADPQSGLWEFWHVGSGKRPEVGPDGRYVLTPETGVVLVLVPGGLAVVGAQSANPQGTAFDRDAESDESVDGTPFTTRLDPYFLSKYELQQAQWTHMGGVNRSSNQSSSLDPVETVTWLEARDVLRTWNLLLPTEAQWEHAMRAGTRTPFPLAGVPGSDGSMAGLARYANTADRAFDEAQIVPGWFVDLALDDGFATTAPIGSLAPDPFGFHDGMGNVYEWCRDCYRRDDRPPREGDGLRPDLGEKTPQRAVRGGCWYFPWRFARPANRFHFVQVTANPFVGIRPARQVDGL